MNSIQEFQKNLLKKYPTHLNYYLKKKTTGESKLPSKWKMAEVIHLFKMACKLTPGNYR